MRASNQNQTAKETQIEVKQTQTEKEAPKVEATQAQLDEFLTKAYPGSYKESEDRQNSLKSKSAQISPQRTPEHKSSSTNSAPSFFKLATTVASSMLNPSGLIESCDQNVHNR